MNKNKKRSFIVDFGCCLPYGHNLQSVNLYKRKEENRGRLSKSIVCKRVKSFDIDNEDDYYFSLPTLHKGLIIEGTENVFLRFYVKVVRTFLLFPFIGKNNLLDLKASRSINKLFKVHNFTTEDILILPSADYYGTKALLKKIQTISIEDRPRIHVRFIGSLETPHSFYKNNLFELIELINNNYQTLTVSAEVPIYAKYLDSIIPKLKVIAEPFPVEGLEKKKSYSIKKEEPFVVLLPGSNRADKGYFDIFNIAKEILFEFPSVKLVVQDMKRQNEFFNRKYRKKLSQLVNVELLDAVLSRKRIEGLYENANLILLPYYPDVYHFRGSGIHYEALQNRIPVLARKGCGFVDEINKWSSGWTYETKQDLLLRLKEIIEMDSEKIDQKMENAFNKFKKTSDEAYRFNMS